MTDHDDPDCGPDTRGSDTTCIDGTIYGPCEAEVCATPCTSYYHCDCKCHRS